jgi:hypothetical protein
MQQTNTKILQFAILEGDNIQPSQLVIFLNNGTAEFYKITNDPVKSFVNTKLNVERIGERLQ